MHVTEEAYTSENWIVRIYRVKPLDNVGRSHAAAAAFEAGEKKKKASAKGPRILRV